MRHEHEVALWEDTKLPDGKILAPGVVTHSTPLIEHPQLVADRIQRFAELVGRENVIASTDCGLGLRCHPQIAWAKLKTLTDGAALRRPRCGADCARATPHRSWSVERDGDCAERSEVGHARVTRAGFEHIGRDARRDDVAATQSKAEPGQLVG